MVQEQSLQRDVSESSQVLTFTNTQIQDFLGEESAASMWGREVSLDRDQVTAFVSLKEEQLLELYNERMERFRQLNEQFQNLNFENENVKKTIAFRREQYTAEEAAANAKRDQIKAEIEALAEQLRALRGDAPLLRTVENAIALSLVRHDSDPSWAKLSQDLTTIRSQVLKDNGQVAKETGEAIRQRRDWYLQILGVSLAFTVLLLGVGLTAAYNSTVGGVAIGIGLIQAALSYGRLFFGVKENNGTK